MHVLQSTLCVSGQEAVTGLKTRSGTCDVQEHAVPHRIYAFRDACQLP